MAALHGPRPGRWSWSGGCANVRRKFGESFVAAGLLRFGVDHGCDGDAATVKAWADQTLPIVAAHGLDPYVGSVTGIGPARFAYLRMRFGGDGIKPDIRVRRGLTNAGFDGPRADLGDAPPRRGCRRRGRCAQAGP